MIIFHKTRAEFIDEGDVVALIDDLPFEYTTLEDITEEQEKSIEWVRVRKAQVTGTLVIFETFGLHDGEVDRFHTADFAKFLILDAW